MDASTATLKEHPKGGRAGFTLIEMLLVLVVAALLIGFLISARSMYRAGEVVRLGKKVEEFKASVNAFRMKHGGIPGDTTRATMYFGTADACPVSSNGTSGTCNGNGDGRIGYATTPFLDPESARFWQHLALAGYIEGSFPGRVDVEGALPSAGVEDAYWGISDLGAMFGSTTYFDGAYNNSLQVGNLISPTTAQPFAGAFSPTSVASIDQKYDDGMPATGIISVHALEGLITCTNTTMPGLTSATYAAADMEAQKCTIVFRSVF